MSSPTLAVLETRLHIVAMNLAVACLRCAQAREAKDAGAVRRYALVEKLRTTDFDAASAAVEAKRAEIAQLYRSKISRRTTLCK